MRQKDWKRQFGQRVKALRKIRKLSQEDLAEAIGKSVDTVSNIERGFAATKLSTAFDIATALDINFVDLFDWLPRRKPSPAEARQDRVIERVKALLASDQPPTANDIAELINALTEKRSKAKA